MFACCREILTFLRRGSPRFSPGSAACPDTVLTQFIGPVGWCSAYPVSRSSPGLLPPKIALAERCGFDLRRQHGPINEDEVQVAGSVTVHCQAPQSARAVPP